MPATTAYNAANKYVPQRVVADSGAGKLKLTTGFTYDAAGNLTSHRKRSGETITLAYDNLNRLTSRSYPSSADNVAFAYDLLGRRTQASFADASHTVAYVWDAAGRLTSTAAGGKTLAYQYDPAGNRTRLTWPKDNRGQTTVFSRCPCPSAGCRWAHLSREQLREVVEVV